jgi:hypothetical protein
VLNEESGEDEVSDSQAFSEIDDEVLNLNTFKDEKEVNIDLMNERDSNEPEKIEKHKSEALASKTPMAGGSNVIENKATFETADKYYKKIKQQRSGRGSNNSKNSKSSNMGLTSIRKNHQMSQKSLWDTMEKISEMRLKFIDVSARLEKIEMKNVTYDNQILEHETDLTASMKRLSQVDFLG